MHRPATGRGYVKSRHQPRQERDMRPTTNTTQANQTNRDFLSRLFTVLSGLIAFVILGAVFVWNWDGFWQTDIKRLQSVQQRYFPSKFKEEQLKLSRVLDNNQIIERIERKLAEADKAVEMERQRAAAAHMALKEIQAKEGSKCQYYKTSLKIIETLVGRISPDELRSQVRCTNQECEQIIKSTPDALSICG